MVQLFFKGWNSGSGTPIPSASLRQVPIPFSGDQIIVYFTEECNKWLNYIDKNITPSGRTLIRHYLI